MGWHFLLLQIHPYLYKMMINQGVNGFLMAREGKAKVLSEEEFKLLLLVAKEGKMGTRNLAIVYCSFGLGLRAKEIASLTIADVCLK